VRGRRRGININSSATVEAMVPDVQQLLRIGALAAGAGLSLRVVLLRVQDARE